MPNVSELSLLPVSRFAPALTDYIVCEVQPNAKGGAPQAVLVPIALLPSGSSGLTVGTTSITGGSNGRLLYDNAGVLGEAIVGSGLSLSGGTLTATGSLSGTGANTQVAFWTGPSTLSSDSGFTYAGNGQVTHALGTITANANALTITGTWNNAAVAFDAPLFMNITNTASAAGSLLIDLQIGSASKFYVDKLGNIGVNGGGPNFNASTPYIASALSSPSFFGYVVFGPDANPRAMYGAEGGSFTFTQMFNGFYGWSSAATVSINDGTQDTQLSRTGVGIMALTRGNALTSGATLQVYNTTDSATAPVNYERGVLDWTTTTNVLTIGTQAGGTGTARNTHISAQGTVVTFGQSATAYAALNLAGNFTLANGILLGFAVSGGFTPGSNLAADSGISRVAAKVVSFNDGGANANGWLQWGGEARATSTTSWTSNVTFSNITGLSVNVQAGRTYAIDIYIPITAGANAGGFQSALSGTCTITSLIIAGFLFDESATGVLGGSATAFGTRTAHGSTTSATATVRMWGTLTVNAAGTLTVQGAQGTSNATTTTAGVGARMIVHDMP